MSVTSNTWQKISIKFVSAKLTRDTDMVGKMDPFVVLEYKGNKYQSQTHKSGGKNPVWNFEIAMYFDSLTDQVKLSVSEEDVTSEELVGES